MVTVSPRWSILWESEYQPILLEPTVGGYKGRKSQINFCLEPCGCLLLFKIWIEMNHTVLSHFHGHGESKRRGTLPIKKTKGTLDKQLTSRKRLMRILPLFRGTLASGPLTWK